MWQRSQLRPLVAAATQIYKQFVGHESFKRFVGDMVFAMTSEAQRRSAP